MAGGKRFTIFDAMEDRGVFRANPANLQAVDSDGRSIYKKVEYPRMLYHPEGQERISVPAAAEMTPFGPQWLGEQRELINRIVNNEEEEREALAEGWHDHPSKAIRARNEIIAKENIERKAQGQKALPLSIIPPLSSDTRISELEAQKRALEDEVKRLRGEQNKAEEENLGKQIESANASRTSRATDEPSALELGAAVRRTESAVVHKSSGKTQGLA
jgi:hypothetical protein